MSAYGPSAARRGGPATLLPATLAALPPQPGAPRTVSVHHLAPQTDAPPPALADYLHAQFQDELVRGTTYPQEWPMARDAFGAYFFGGDLFVGIMHDAVHDAQHALRETPLALADARASREWAACVGGVYYVKPNYPGRSSHICNAGFLVPPRFRGIGVATVLARSFLFYAPRLGYTASVFNLVYVNNVASVRIWERLGFQKVGRIPRAGRLRRRVEDSGPGGTEGGGGEVLEGGGRPEGDNEEEYVDAWVIYKDFESPDGGDITTMAT